VTESFRPQNSLLAEGSEVTVNNKYSMISIMMAVYYTCTQKKENDGILQLTEQRFFFPFSKINLFSKGIYGGKIFKHFERGKTEETEDF
jgi:hypothetical protein